MNGEQRSPIQKFQGLLRELFQFDCADLDFGIYRIMNRKRDVVERLISTKLPETVEAELSILFSRSMGGKDNLGRLPLKDRVTRFPAMCSITTNDFQAIALSQVSAESPMCGMRAF